ncbi:MAG: hypothetical protein WDW38_003448 [Sanguina aurantia]
MELQSCDLGTLQHALGPLLHSRAVAHSAVVGDGTVVMQYYRAVSKMLKPSNQQIHPLARLISSPTVTPSCLPLTGPRHQPQQRHRQLGQTSGGDVTFIDLDLQVPSHISAISLQQPLLMPWDPASDVATLHLLVQAPATDMQDVARSSPVVAGQTGPGHAPGSSGQEWVSAGMYNFTRSLLKVLISTDNHLGVWEKDEIRKDDSFRAFEEVLKTATQLNVDFVVSDQAQNFESKQVNFENPNHNVGLPVLTIHGNHDDPSGSDNLSAVDILSSCNLVNYFGKLPIIGSSVGKVTLSPVLIQKGMTKLALYGLGNIRDERLFRSWQTPGMVKWERPASTSEADADHWVNLLVLHQNRVQHGAFAKNCIQEHQLPLFLDLAIWGHEHECRADPEDIPNPPGVTVSVEKRRSIIQPGSSVATALSEGEAKRKHVVCLEIMGDRYRSVKYPLHSVRPFMYSRAALRDVTPSLPDEDPEAVQAYLEGQVDELIQQALQEFPPVPGTPPLLPVIRLRVNYTGYSTINAQRFGQKYVGKVANPHDVLDMHKEAVKRLQPETLEEANQRAESLRPEPLDQHRIEDLIAQNLPSDMQVLQQEELANALHDYVEKDNKQALHEMVANALDKTKLNAGQDSSIKYEELEDEIAKRARARRFVPDDPGAMVRKAAASASVGAHPAASAAAAGTSQTMTSSTRGRPPPELRPGRRLQVQRGQGGNGRQGPGRGGCGWGYCQGREACCCWCQQGCAKEGGRAPAAQDWRLVSGCWAAGWDAGAESGGASGATGSGQRGASHAHSGMAVSDDVEQIEELEDDMDVSVGGRAPAAAPPSRARPARAVAAKGRGKTKAAVESDDGPDSSGSDHVQDAFAVSEDDGGDEDDIMDELATPRSKAGSRKGNASSAAAGKASVAGRGRAPASGGKAASVTQKRGRADGTQVAGKPQAHDPHSLKDSDDEEERPHPHTKSAPTAASGAGGRKRPAFLSGATNTQNTAGAKAAPARDWGPHR